jgi:hypothetical protein
MRFAMVLPGLVTGSAALPGRRLLCMRRGVLSCDHYYISGGSILKVSLACCLSSGLVRFVRFDNIFGVMVNQVVHRSISLHSSRAWRDVVVLLSCIHSIILSFTCQAFLQILFKIICKC